MSTAQELKEEAAAAKDAAAQHSLLEQARKDAQVGLQDYTRQLELQALQHEEARKAAEKMLEAEEKLALAGENNAAALEAARLKLKDLTKEAKKAAGAQKKFGTSLFESMGFVTDMEEKQKSLAEQMAESEDIVKDLSASFKELKDSGALTEGIMRGIDDILIGLAMSAIQLALANDKALASFHKSTGAGKQYDDQLKSLYRSNNEFGVSMEDNTAAFGALFSTMTDFTTLGSGQQNMLTEQAALLEKVGVANEDYAQSIQISTKMLGMNVDAAADATNELTAVAKEMGVAPSKMVKDFAAAGPVLAKFGDSGVEVFKDLAGAAKATGIETARLLEITGKFDTFDDAAKSVGGLNAILGGDYLNSMEMITTTDPTERLRKMKDAVDSAGMSFDSMSYYEKIALQEAMGLKDVGELAMLMKGDLDEFGGATQATAEELIEQKKAAAEAMDVMQALQAMLADNSEVFLTLAEAAIDFVRVLTALGPAIKFIIPMLAILSVSMKLLGISQMFVAATGQALAMRFGIILAIVTALGFILFVHAWGSNFADALIVLGLAFLILAAAVFVLDKTGQRAVPFLLALGQTIMMIGAGVGIAAAGFGYLAESMAKLSGPQLAAFTTALIGFGIAFVALLVALGVLAYSGLGPLAVAILIGFGQAVLLIGLGVGIAAAGVGLMAEGFAVLFEAIDTEKMLAFSLFVATVGLAAAFMPAAALGIGSMALGFGALALALAFIKTADLEAIAKFAEAMANIEYETLSSVADEIERMAAAIDEIPTAKTVMLTGLFKTGALGIGGGGGKAEKAKAPTPAPIEINLEVHIGNEKLDARIKRISSEDQQSGLEKVFSAAFRT